MKRLDGIYRGYSIFEKDNVWKIELEGKTITTFNKILNVDGKASCMNEIDRIKREDYHERERNIQRSRRTSKSNKRWRSMSKFIDVKSHNKTVLPKDFKMNSIQKSPKISEISDGMLGFEFNGQYIVDPTMDETGRYPVDGHQNIIIYQK
jgi:hypothetical protein